MTASPELLPTTLLARAWDWKANPFGLADESGHVCSEHYSYDLRSIIHVSPDIEGLQIRVSEFIHKLDKDPEGYGTQAAAQLREDMAAHGVEVAPPPAHLSPSITNRIKNIFRR